MFKNLKFPFSVVLRSFSVDGRRMNKIKNFPKGVSIPLVTGLVTLLMVASVTANELVIRSIRSVRGVESSNRAYFAAEAGIEDGLYELTPHLAGYQTPNLESNDVRGDQFETARWYNRWAVESKSASPNWSGEMFKNQKLVISLFTDNESGKKDINAINVQPASVTNLRPTNFQITFSLPENTERFLSRTPGDILRVDNDEDGRLNEDEGGIIDNTPFCGSIKNLNPKDNDCDGKVNEDSNESPVILWKLFDNTGRRLIPIKGCISEDPLSVSELCEKDFIYNNSNYAATLSDQALGQREDGTTETIQDFFAFDPNARLQFEFLIVIPMHTLNGSTLKSYDIPFFDYKVQSSNTIIPYPYFTLKSDGYFGTYKQSLTTTVTPKTTVPLFDFTIIQQQ